MFLLILNIRFASTCSFVSLNSIMFLLIQKTSGGKKVKKKSFKFHYVSINSTKAQKEFLFSYYTLNSIMFLLIPKGFRLGPVKHINFKFHYVSINSGFKKKPVAKEDTLNSIMFLLIPVPKPTAYLLHETPLFCRPLQNISFLSHSSSYVLATPPILAIFYFCRFPAFFTLSQVDRNHYIFIISSFLLA